MRKVKDVKDWAAQDVVRHQHLHGTAPRVLTCHGPAFNVTSIFASANMYAERRQGSIHQATCSPPYRVSGVQSTASRSIERMPLALTDYRIMLVLTVLYRTFYHEVRRWPSLRSHHPYRSILDQYVLPQICTRKRPLLDDHLGMLKPRSRRLTQP